MKRSQPHSFFANAPQFWSHQLRVLCGLGLALALMIDGFAQQKKEDNLAYADLLFEQKEFTKAATQYQIFIRENATSPNAQAGWYRLGECYLQVGQVNDAKTTFTHVVKTYTSGVYVGSAAYRLAVLAFNAKNYPEAMVYFEVASREMPTPDAKHQSRYYLARCLQFTGQLDEALALYDNVVSTIPDPAKNPFLERSLLESARIFIEQGKKEQALEKFQLLAKTATQDTFREESIVQSGMLARELGRTEESENYLTQALQFPSTSPWKPLALVGAIFNAFDRKDYDRVISIYSAGNLATTSEEHRSSMLLCVAHSYRIKGDLENAQKLYSTIETRYPTTPVGLEAGYRKLQILYMKGSTVLPTEARKFVTAVERKDPGDANIDMAHLMTAEYFFTQAEKAAASKDANAAKSNYRAAAAAYAKVREEKIKEDFHPMRLYKQGWAYLEAGELQQGVLALSRFIKRFRENPLTSSALAKRGDTYMSIDDFDYALQDYQMIIEGFPNSPELELAMQQRALIFAQKRDLPKMIDAFQELLKRFPNTPGKAEATYWIGVGLFDLEQYQQCIPPLQSAMSLNSALFTNRATIRMILAYSQLEQLNELAENASNYLQRKDSAQTSAQDRWIPIPNGVLEYLGKRLAKEEKFQVAEFFLTELSTPESPEQTSAAIWRLLADCRMKIQKWQEAIPAYDFFILQVAENIDKGYAFVEKGKAHLALKQFPNARTSAEDCLRLVKQGPINAQARILLGDISSGEGNLEDAASEFKRVSLIIEDPAITPLALTKAIEAYQSLGNLDEASRLRSELRSKYPDYR